MVTVRQPAKNRRGYRDVTIIGLPKEAAMQSAQDEIRKQLTSEPGTWLDEEFWKENEWGGMDCTAAPVRFVDDDGDTILHVFTDDRARLLRYTIRFGRGTPTEMFREAARLAIRESA